MEPTQTTGATIGQAAGGLMKNLIESHPLVLTPQEKELVLNWPLDKPRTDQVQEAIDKLLQAEEPRQFRRQRE